MKNIFLYATMLAGFSVSAIADETSPSRMEIENINSSSWTSITVNISDLDSESNLTSDEYTTISASTSESTTVSADIDDYNNKALAVYSAVNYKAYENTTITINYGDSDREDDNMTWVISSTDANSSWTPNDSDYFDASLVLSSSANGGNVVFNVYDNLTINALQNSDNSYTGNTALLLDDKANFYVKDGGTATLNGNLETSFSGISDSSRITSLMIGVEENATLTVNGDANIAIGLTVAGTAKITGDASFGGSTISTSYGDKVYAYTYTISGNLNIGGDASFAGVNVEDSTGSITIGGDASFVSNSTAVNTLGVNTTVDGLVSVSDSLTLNSTLAVKGADVIENDVTQTNTFTSVTIDGTGSIDIDGNATFTGSNTVNVDTTVDGDLYLDNASLVGTGSFTIGDLILIGDNTIGVNMDFGDLSSFDSNITFGSGTTVADDVPTISFNGAITFNGDLGLDSAIIKAGGDITVEQLVSFSGLNTINSALTVKGADVIDESDGVTVSQTNTFSGATFDGTGSIDINGNATFTGVNTLNVDTNIDGTVTLNNATLTGSTTLDFDTVTFTGSNTISTDTSILSITNDKISNLTVSDATLNLYDPNPDTTASDYVAAAFIFNNSTMVLENATVNIYGSLTNSTYSGTSASMSIDSTSTLSTTGNFTLRGTLDLEGTLNVGGTLNLEKQSTSNVTTTASTILTLHSGAEIITSDNKISLSSGSNWKVHLGLILIGDYENASDSALSGMDIVFNAGSSNADNLVYVDFTFNDGVEYATGLVSLGKLTISNRNIVTFNLAGLSADSTTILIEDLTMNTITKGSTSFVITDFADYLIQFSSDGEKILEDLTLTTDGDNQYLTIGDNSILLTVTDSEDQTVSNLTLDDSGFLIVAVPEPSTYAAIFGALALGLAMYRRRK